MGAGSQTFFHPGEGPGKIDRRGTGGFQIGAGLPQRFFQLLRALRIFLPGPQPGAISGGHPDGRSPPHLQNADGCPHLLRRFQLLVLYFPRQKGLVYNAQRTRFPVKPVGPQSVLHGISSFFLFLYYGGAKRGKQVFFLPFCEYNMVYYIQSEFSFKPEKENCL